MIKVGDEYEVDARGKVPTVSDQHALRRARMRIDWVSSDASVVEGVVTLGRAAHKVTVARCLLGRCVTGAAPPPKRKPRKRAKEQPDHPGIEATPPLSVPGVVPLLDQIAAAKAAVAAPAAPKKRKPRKRKQAKPDYQWPAPEGAPRERDASREEGRLAAAIKLRPYQLEGAAWLSRRTSALLSDVPGLGKTGQIMAAFPPGAPVLVITPAVGRDEVWPKHIGWRDDLRSQRLVGRRNFRWPVAGEVVIATYDSLPDWLDDRKIPLPPFGTVVVMDEAHLCKNPSAKRTRRVRRACRAVRELGGATWLVTGTPLKNTPDDLWALIRLAGLEGETWGTAQRFKAAFGWDKHTKEYASAIDSQVPEVLRRVMLRREFADVIPDMPPQQWEKVEVEIPDSVVDVCDAVQAALEASGIDLAQATQKALLDKSTNEIQGEFMSARALLAAAKVPALLELVEQYDAQGDRPLVVFSAHLAPLQALETREGWAKITGSESPARRAELETAFQAGELKGLGITIGPCATAISLSRARQAIFVDRGWTPADNEQAEQRIYRADEQTIGTEEPVIYSDLVAGHPLDYMLARLLARKRKVQKLTVSAARVQPGAIEVVDELQPRASGSAREYWAEDSLATLVAGRKLAGLDRVALPRLAQQLKQEGLSGVQWTSLCSSLGAYESIVGRAPAL